MNSTKSPPRRKSNLFFLSLATIFLTITVIGIAIWLLKINEIVNDIASISTFFGSVSTIFSLVLVLSERRSSLTDKTEELSIAPAIQLPALEGVTAEMLCLAKDKGAFLIYTNNDMLGAPVNLIFGFNRFNAKADFVEHVGRFKKDNRTIFICIFKGLPTGNYSVSSDKLGLWENLTIEPWNIKEIDRRRRAKKHVDGKLEV